MKKLIPILAALACSTGPNTPKLELFLENTSPNELGETYGEVKFRAIVNDCLENDTLATWVQVATSQSPDRHFEPQITDSCNGHERTYQYSQHSNVEWWFYANISSQRDSIRFIYSSNDGI